MSQPTLPCVLSYNCRIAVPGFALNAFNVRDAFINQISLNVKKTLDNQVCIVNCQVCEYLYSYATVYVFSCSCFPDAALSTEKRPNAKKEHCRGQICIVYRFFSDRKSVV